MSFLSKFKDKAALKIERTKTPLLWESRRNQNIANTAARAALDAGTSTAEPDGGMHSAQDLVAENCGRINDLENRSSHSETASYLCGESFRSQPKPVQNPENLAQTRSELEAEYVPTLQTESEIPNDSLIQAAEDRAELFKKKVRNQAALHAQQERHWEKEKKSLQRSFDEQIAEKDALLAAAIQNFDQHLAEQQQIFVSSTSEARTQYAQTQAELGCRISGLEILLRSREQEASKWQSRAETEAQKHVELKARMDDSLSELQRKHLEEMEHLRDEKREMNAGLQRELRMQMDELEKSFQVEKQQMTEIHKTEKEDIIGTLEDRFQKQSQATAKKLLDKEQEMANFQTQNQTEMVRLQEAEARTKKSKDQLEKKLDIFRKDYETMVAQASKDHAHKISRLVKEHKNGQDKLKGDLVRLRTERDKARREFELIQIDLKRGHHIQIATAMDDIDMIRRKNEAELEQTWRDHNKELAALANQKEHMIEDLKAKMEAERQEVESRMKQLISQMATIGTESEANHREKQSLQAKLQSQIETTQQRTIALNTALNELSQEKRKATAAKAECARKDQQLEYVQQKCVDFQKKQDALKIAIESKTMPKSEVPRQEPQDSPLRKLPDLRNGQSSKKLDNEDCKQQ